MDTVHNLDAPLETLKCEACEGNVPRLDSSQIATLMSTLGDDWLVEDHHHLRCEYRFPNFKDALAFTNQVGALAEAEGHHPDIALGWGKADITLWTHAVDGLTMNDFILAAKISELWAERNH